MAVIVGTCCYGYVDRIPGIGYIATKFLHFNYFPLVPLKSFFVLEEESGAGFRGRELTMNWKSVLVGYLRGWGVFACVIAAGLNWYSLGHAIVQEQWIGIVWALIGLLLMLGAAFLWNRLWIVCQGLFHLGSLGGWAAVAAMGRTFEFIDIVALCANGLLLVYGLTRLMDNAGRGRATELMELMGYDRETAEKIVDKQIPGRQPAARGDDD